jgi:hypothetical protein
MLYLRMGLTFVVHVVQCWLVVGTICCGCHGKTSVLHLGGPRFDSQPSYCLEGRFLFFSFVRSGRVPQLKIPKLYKDMYKIFLMVSNGTGCFVCETTFIVEVSVLLGYVAASVGI